MATAQKASNFLLSCFCRLFGALCITLGQWSVLAAAAPGQKEVQQCGGCHAQQVQDWQSSHHYHAMSVASDASVLGDFRQQRLDYQGRTVRFFRRDKRFIISMPNLHNDLQDFVVTHTFGVAPLQQYMFEISPGKFQFFPFAWDARERKDGGQRWFVLYPNLEQHDEFHWSQMGQNWNQMCAECHVTDYQKNYDHATGQYSPKYSAINVSCNACHGSSEKHLAWAQQQASTSAEKEKDVGFDTYIGMKSPLFRADDEGVMKSIARIRDSHQIEVCASCHSRRSAMADRGQPQDYFHHYRPELISDALYHADGQVREENYVWGSFLQSKMYAAGVSCTNCHNPHSGKLTLPGNETCTQCHDRRRYDLAAHHGHRPATAGAMCVDCHMPATTFMQIDARRDHSFQISRPDLSRQFGVPNACISCHTQQTNEWAEREIKKLHPASHIRQRQHFSQIFSDAAYIAQNMSNGQPDSGANKLAKQNTEALLALAHNEQNAAIVRASALARLTSPSTPDTRRAIAEAAQDQNPLQRLAAIEASETYPLAERWRLLKGLLQDSYMPVRAEAAKVLAAMMTVPTLTKTDKARLHHALEEYRTAQHYQADRGFSHTRLGDLALRLENSAQAQLHFEEAIKVEPVYLPAYINLADLFRQQRDEDKVQEVLQKALTIHPQSNTAHYALAMSLVRQGKKDRALSHLAQAASHGQVDSRSVYAYALLLQDLGKSASAKKQLHRAFDLTPGNPDISYSLAQLYLREGDINNALLFARKLIQLVPDTPHLQQWLRRIEQMQAQP
ncbi:Beta-barrel assembly-enhancing protease [Thalassocella blandensis]|nr:Beta-barrel assembly-enhancing protease [Thalassocella blandensis]